ncbi:MAG: CopD family protein [Gammaproteobacteria bacterium]|nr:CopD family protein [Gammaproteobacteria bacterium]
MFGNSVPEMLWIKTIHILFVTAWMAGIFYLPRIFVHYVEGQQHNEDTRRLVVMADKLVRFTAVMAVLASIFGVWLWLGYGITGHWLTIKLVFVVILMAYHLQCYRYTLLLKRGAEFNNSFFFRLFNESILLILIPILILVVVKPV